LKPRNLPEQLLKIEQYAQDFGFSQIGVSDVDLHHAEAGLLAWLEAGFHGSMDYMAAHGLKRARPAELVPGTVRVICARMDYLPRDYDLADGAWRERELARLQNPSEGIISVYARGRDYHKVLRQRLQKLAERIAADVGPLGHRVFTDSAPVLEVEMATGADLGWRGKHTLMLSREGSMSFIGEIYIDLPLPPTPRQEAMHCGTCTACISACPTGAIVAPYRLDARRCISYLTIELQGAIPPEFRPLIGNRIYGCDDCQLVCPWNKFAGQSTLPDFDSRPGLSGSSLLELFAWSEADFLQRTEGSPMRRVGHDRWLRNIAVALGNALASPLNEADRAEIRSALSAALERSSPLVQEHIDWALAQNPSDSPSSHNGPRKNEKRP
jgi:epoxyqueuosine reductase